jgi:hypothetical protein
MSEMNRTTLAECNEGEQDLTDSANGVGARPHRDQNPTLQEEPATTRPADDEPRPWRDGFILSYKYQAIFDVPVDIRTADLPRWRPRSIGDYGRAGQGDK